MSSVIIYVIVFMQMLAKMVFFILGRDVEFLPRTLEKLVFRWAAVDFVRYRLKQALQLAE